MPAQQHLLRAETPQSSNGLHTPFTGTVLPLPHGSHYKPFGFQDKLHSHHHQALPAAVLSPRRDLLFPGLGAK